MSLATRSSVERALGAWLRTITFDDQTLEDFGGRFPGAKDELVPLGVHCICGEVGETGEIPEDWSKVRLPAFIVSSPRSAPLEGNYAWDVCEVSIIAMTSADEIGAPAKVQERIGWLGALFDDDNLDGIAEALASESLQIIGIVRDGEDHTENGRHILSSLRLKVHALGLPD